MPTIDTVRALARERRQRGNLADHYKTEGTHRVGANLYLRVRKGSEGRLLKIWLHRYGFREQPRSDSLGSAYAVTVDDACRKVDAANDLLDQGYDPRGASDERRSPDQTFQEGAEDFLATQFPDLAIDGRIDEDRLKEGPKHLKQWVTTVRATYPKIGPLIVDQVDHNHIAALLRPDWRRTPETSRRVLRRLHMIFVWLIALERRTVKVNPADRETLTVILRDNNKDYEKRHFPSLLWRDVPGFWRELQGEEGLSAIALKLAILSAKRTKEVLLAHKTEFNMGTLVWTIPRGRMKVKRGHDHAVPITSGMAAVLEPLLALRLPGAYLFPGAKAGRPLSNMAMLTLLKRMGYAGTITPHGFRASLRTWVAEELAEGDPSLDELAKVALAHALKDKVDAAYQRSELLERRRRLMQRWDDLVHDRGDGAPTVPARRRLARRAVAVAQA